VYFGACGLLALASCRPSVSQVPLGGVREEAEARAPKPSPSTLPVLPAAAAPPALAAAEEDEDDAQAEEVEVSAGVALGGTGPGEAGKLVAPSAFQVKPYVARQAWTRVVDIDVSLKVGPGGNLDMKMTTHQEARFEVVSVGSDGIEKLAIEYPIYTTKLSFMGSAQDSPEELAGKRFVVTFNRGKPEVRDGSGGQPPKKQVDSVKDDAREPLETEKALKELTALTAKGRGDFSALGAIALAGGEDEDTKVTSARGALQKLLTTTSGERSAVVELAYTATSELDERSTLEVRVAGSLTVIDAPSRYQSSTMQGPMELRSSEPGGLAGRGSIKVSTSYRY
jgi:hypothetical protein